MAFLKKKVVGWVVVIIGKKQQGIKMVGCAAGLHMCEKCGGDGDGCVARMVVVVLPPATHRPRKYQFLQKNKKARI